MADQPRRQRQRWPWYLLGVLLLAALGVAGAVRWFADPARLTARLTGIAFERSGLTIVLDGNADFRYWPSLRLHLPAPRVSGAGDPLPLLAAQAADVVLPWASLWSDELVIDRIDLLAPTIHIDRLQHWLAASGQSDGDMPPFQLRLRVRDGALYRDGEVIVAGMTADIRTGSALLDWLDRHDALTSSLIPPLQGDAAIDELQIGDTRIEGLQIRIGSAAERAADHGADGQ